MRTTEIETNTGVWKIQIKASGDTQIVDAHGRQRCRNHEMTAVHLAMLMARADLLPFGEAENMDHALQMAAERFAAEEPECA